MEALTEAPMSLGERFRAAREQRGLTLSDVAEQIRIRSVYLAAIEEEQWSTIGAPVYARGFLRTYARYLGLDPEEAVGAFNATGAGATAVSQRAPSITYSRPRRSLGPLIWIAGAIAVVLIAFVVYIYLAPPRSSRSGLAASAPTAAPGPTAVQTAAAPVLAQTLGVHFTDASWVRVTVDGTVSIEGTFPAGTSKTFHGKSATVRVGNAGGVQIIVDGRPIGTLGGTGDVAEKSFVL